MKLIKVAVFSALFLLMTSFSHKYYVSVTQIDYIEEKQSLQIITRIDVDDLELTLQERYDQSIDLTSLDEKESVDTYIERYLRTKLQIKVNTKTVSYVFVGKEYDNDQLVCYLEVSNINHINTIEVTNTLLFDKFEDQKNVLKVSMYSKRFNLVCTRSDDTEYLNF